MRSHALALSVACVVVISGAASAGAATNAHLAEPAAALAQDIASGFGATFGDIPERLAARIADAHAAGAARVTLASARDAYVAPHVLVPVDIAMLSALAMKEYRAPRLATEDSFASRGSVSIGDLQSSIRDGAALLASPARVGSAVADAYASVPQTVSRMNLALGNTIIAASHVAVQADVALAYGLATQAPEVARVTVTALGNAGDTLARATAQIPPLAATAYMQVVALPATAAPALAQAIFRAEYSAATRFIAFTNAVTGRYLSFVNDTGSLAYAGTEKTIALAERAQTLVAQAPASLEDAYLGTLGKGALMLYTVPPEQHPVAAALTGSASVISTGEQMALAIYQAIRGFFDSTGRMLATLFGLTGSPQVAVVSSTPAVATSSRPTTYTLQPIASISYPTYTTVVQGVSPEFMNQSLASLRSDILATVGGMIQPVAAQTATNMTTIQQVNMIQDLSNLIVRNGSFRGGTFDSGTLTNGISVSATTGSFSSLTSTAGNFTSLVAGGATNLATTTLIGNLTLTGNEAISGTLTIGTTTITGPLSASDVITGSYFTATSSTATSTFAGSLAVGTNQFVIQHATGNVGIGILSPAALLAIKNSTSTQPIFTASNAAGAEVYRITDAGFVGIGTTSPTYALSVEGSSSLGNQAIAGYFTATSSTATSTFAGSLAIGTTSPFANGLFTAGTSSPLLFISRNSGRIGIGTTSPLANLGLQGSIGVNVSHLYLAANGTVGIGTTTPDAMLSLLQNANGEPIISAYRATDAAPSGDFINYKTNAGTTLFRVDNSGNLLAGGIINSGSQTITSISSPQFRVQYDPSNEWTASIGATGATTFGVNGSAPSLTFTPQSNSTNTFNFTNALGTNSILSIDTLNQRVGIGTTSPAAKLSINSAATGMGLYLAGYANGTGALFSVSTSTASATTTAFAIDNNGNLSLFNGANLSIGGNLTATGGFLSNASSTITSGLFTMSGGASTTALTNSGSTWLTGLSASSLLATNANKMLISTSTIGVNNLALAKGNFIVGNDAGIAQATSTIFISSTGNFGVGTTSPWAQLSVEGKSSLGNYAVAGAYFATTTFSGSFTDGIVADYTTGQGRLSVGASDGFGFYNGGPANTALATINSSGYLGVGTTSPSSLLSISNNLNTVVNTPLFTIASTTGGTATSTLMTVLAGGNVGVGTSSPNFKLDVNGIVNATALYVNGTPYIGSQWTTAGSNIYYATGSVGIGTTTPWGQLSVNPNGITGPAFVIGSSTATNFIVTSGGSVGIGTTAQNAKLDVNGAVAVELTNGSQILLNHGGTGWGLIGNNGIGAWSLGYSNAGGSTFDHSDLTWTNTGNVGIGTTSPSSLLSISNNLNTAANTPLFTVASTTGGTSTSTLMTILANGNVGVGTTTPGSLLSIQGIANFTAATSTLYGTGLNIASGCFAVNGVCVGGGSGGVGSGTQGQLAFYNAAGSNLTATSSLFLSQAGYFGVGTTSPEDMFVVRGNGIANLAEFYSAAGASVLKVLDNGNVGIGTTSPFTALGVVGTTRLKSTTNSTSALVVENASATQTLAVSTVDDSSNIFSVASSTGASYFEITSGGYIGIGTTSPETTLTVVGAICAARSAGTQTAACGTTQGAIYANSSSLTGGYDIAEMYPTSDATLGAGEVVSFDTVNAGSVARAATSTAPFLGIVSTSPGLTLGSSAGGAIPLTLAGRVPTKVSAANGPIAAGDRLILSTTTPGVAVKALHSGEMIGVALASYSASGIGSINAFVSPQYWLAPGDITISETSGMVGIGTAIPNHTLTVAGDVGAIAFVNTSTRDAKTDISYVDASSTESMLSQLVHLKVATYRYKIEDQNDPLRIGFLAEDAQTIAPEILSPDGKGVDIYKFATFTLAGVQALAARVAAQDEHLTSLESRVAKLESGAVSVSGGLPAQAGSLLTTTSLASAFQGFGALIGKGIAQFNTLVFRQLVAGKDSNGTSSAGSVTLIAGNTVAQVTNALVVPSTKVFITFNSQIAGSWWVSDKTAGAFRVVLSAPQTTDVSFDYFLVQTEGQMATSTPDGSFPSAPGVSQSVGPDTVPPVITLLGGNPMHISVGGAFTEPGVVITDNVDGTDPYLTFINGVQQAVSSTTIDTLSPTTYIITYSATDRAGNSSTAHRSIIVGNPDGTVTVSSGTSIAVSTTTVTTATSTPVSADTIPPVVTLNGAAAMQTTVGGTFTDPGATATDNVDGDLTAKIVKTGSVDTTTANLYTLTYTATDAAGNSGSVSRVVTVAAAVTPPASVSTSTPMTASSTPSI